VYRVSVGLVCSRDSVYHSVKISFESI
jgi:hypothetical protein